MSFAFGDLTLYKALSIAQNDAASSTDKIVTSETIKCQYCIPKNFTKRMADLTAPESQDPATPDTGVAMNVVEILFQIDRGPANEIVLDKLMTWFYTPAEDAIFKRGFLGLLNDDNPELDLKPIALAGYRIITFQQIPDTENPASQQFLVQLQFEGDHTQLGAFI